MLFCTYKNSPSHARAENPFKEQWFIPLQSIAALVYGSGGSRCGLLPSSFCLRALLSNADNGLPLCSASSSSVPFFPLFHYLARELGFLLVTATCQALDPWPYISKPQPRILPGLPARRGALGCPRPRCPPALMLPDSCDRIQEELSAGPRVRPSLSLLALLQSVKLSSASDVCIQLQWPSPGPALVLHRGLLWGWVRAVVRGCPRGKRGCCGQWVC